MSTNEVSLVPLKCRKFVASEKLAGGYCLKEMLELLPWPGVTWRASDPDLKKDLALYFLPDAVTSDPKAMEAIKREVHKNRQMVHPQIVRFYDVVEGEGWIALAMEYVEGESLSQALKRKKFFECRELQDWLAQICSTLDDAHQDDLLHSDLRPENFLIKGNGELMVANFGVSRAIRDSLEKSSNKKPTKADDIRGIGLLLYQLLAGHCPELGGQGESGKAMLPPISVRRKELGLKGDRILPEWEKTIAMCLDKNAGLRPKNPLEIMMRLGGQRPVSTSPLSPITPMSPMGNPQRSTHGATSLGTLAIRSTVKPGGKSEEEAPAQSAEATKAEEAEIKRGKEDQPEFKNRVVPLTRPNQGNVFMPFQSPLEQNRIPRRTGPILLIGVCALILALVGGGGYWLFSHNRNVAPKVAASPGNAGPVPAGEGVGVAVPTASLPATPDAVAQATQATPISPAVNTPAPETPKAKVWVEPVKIPEEETAFYKRAMGKSSAVETARLALEENERVRQEKQLLQEAALAALKEAQASAEKANAELLLRQAATDHAAKSVADVAREASQKIRAIKDAEAERAQYQAVAEQIASLKQERAVETEYPAAVDGVVVPAAPDPTEPVPVPVTARPTVDIRAPQEFTNSLGMRFVPVGDVKFSVWLTRVQDFEVFASTAGLKSTAWKETGFAQTPLHPVVNVSWKEASAFCKWLTLKERKEGRLPADMVYRLPTDLEWSQAVGLPFEKGRSAQSRDMDIPGVYPWGIQWPPPEGAGNFTGEETGSDAVIKGYNDHYAWTSPVGSFAPNKYGLYDMGGNAWQWCMDWWNEEKKARVLRGSSWCNSALNLSLLSSCRFHAAPESATESYGFRCVLAPEGYQ